MHNTRAQAIPFPISRFRWLLLALVVTLAGMTVAPLATVRAQTDTPGNGPASSIVPDTALFYAHVDLDTQSSQMQLALSLLDRAGLSEFSGDELTSEIPEGASAGIVVTSLSSASEVNIEGVASNPLSAAEELESGGYAMVLSGADPQGIMDEILASDFDATDGEVATTDYNGTTITTFTPTDTEFDDAAAIALVGDYVVQASRVEDIQPFIDTAAGTAAPLADNEQFQTLTGMLPQERMAIGFLNGPGILASLQESSPEILETIDPRTTSLLDSWSAFSVSAEESGFRVETRSIAGADAFDEITPLDGEFLNSVPADSLVVVNGNNIDATGAVTSIALILASSIIGEDPFSATPVAGGAALDEDAIFEQASSMLGFNIKTDFVDHLVGEFGLAVSVNGPITSMDSPPAVDAILFSDVDNASAVQDVMSKVAFIVGAGLGESGTVDTREVDGSQVHVVDISQSGFAEKVEFGVVNDQWVVSVGSGLDSYLAGADAPLAQDPNFQAVMEHLPSEYGSVAYINMPKVISLVSEATSGLSANIEDADPSCGEFATQADAQAAYDADQFENFLLDQDFDGEACEDFFNPSQAASPEAAANPYPNVIGLATVSTQEDGVNGTSTYLLIGGE